MKRLLQRIYESVLVTAIINASKKFTLPGFDRIPLYQVAVFFIRAIVQGSVTSRAAAVAFSFFLALFPAIIFFFTIIPYLPILGFEQTLLGLLRDVIPGNAYLTIESTVFDIVTRKQGGLLSIGFLMAFYFSTNGINSLILAFNQSIHTTETRNGVYQRLISLLLVVILTLLTIVAIGLITIGSIGLNYLKDNGFIQDWISYYSLFGAKWVVLIALFFFCISFLFYLAPAKKTRFRFISAGSTLATVLSLLTCLGFDYYVSNFSKYNALYGSIGTILIILLWIYFNAIALITGFELNASIKSAKKNHGVLK
jgi:membrane protein